MHRHRTGSLRGGGTDRPDRIRSARVRRAEAFRIYKSRYASSALTGEGAKKWGGRWNHEGVAVLYASSSLALAQLETLVHLDGTMPPGGFEFLKLDFPANCV